MNDPIDSLREYSGPAVVVYEHGFHGVDIEIRVDDEGPLCDWEGMCVVTDPQVSRWGALVGTEVTVILPGLVLADAIVVDFVYAGAGTARSRLVANGAPRRVS